MILHGITLLGKQGTKGSEIKHEYLEMADYLLPFNNHLTIEEKCEMFEVKNRMKKNPLQCFIQ